MESRLKRCAILAETLDDENGFLGNDACRSQNNQDDEKNETKKNNGADIHWSFLSRMIVAARQRAMAITK